MVVTHKGAPGHRKPCRYFKTSLGCHRKESCQYLHTLEKDTMEIEEVDTEVVRETVKKDIQTEVEKRCSCEVDCEQSDVLIKEDKIICVLKRAKCSETEWKEYEEKVESEMDFKDLLEDLGNVIEAASRLSGASIILQNCKITGVHLVISANCLVQR